MNGQKIDKSISQQSLKLARCIYNGADLGLQMIGLIDCLNRTLGNKERRTVMELDGYDQLYLGEALLFKCNFL